MPAQTKPQVDETVAQEKVIERTNKDFSNGVCSGYLTYYDEYEGRQLTDLDVYTFLIQNITDVSGTDQFNAGYCAGWIEAEGAYIEFATASSYYHTKAGRTGHGRKDYRGQVEYFAVYCPDTGKVYLVPVDHVGTTNARLRLVETGNKQSKNVRWAKDYEL